MGEFISKALVRELINPSQSVQIWLEAGVCGGDDRDATVVVHVVGVFGEVGSEKHNLVAGIQNGLQHHVEACGGPTSHDDLVHRESRDRLGLQGGSYGFSSLRISGVGHVAVHALDRVFGKPAQLLVELGWRVYYRVAQGQVENLVLAVLTFQGDSCFEHTANPAAFLGKPLYFF